MTNNPNNIYDFDLSKMMGQFKLPEFTAPDATMESMVDAQRKNLEAMVEANKMAFEGAQAVLHRQSELAKQAMEDMAAAAQGMTDFSNPQKQMEQQAEITQDAFDRALANMKELTEMLANSNHEVFNLLNNRMEQVWKEYQSILEDAKAPADSKPAAEKAQAKPATSKPAAKNTKSKPASKKAKK